jgi:putative transposase
LDVERPCHSTTFFKKIGQARRCKGAKIVNLTVSRDTSGRYFVSIFETDVEPLRKAEAEAGIDVGIKTLATTSDGVKLENPRPHLRRDKRLKVSLRWRGVTM